MLTTLVCSGIPGSAVTMVSTLLRCAYVCERHHCAVYLSLCCLHWQQHVHNAPANAYLFFVLAEWWL